MSVDPLPAPAASDPLDAATDQVIALCDGDIRAALRTLIIANGMLETELRDARASSSKGYARRLPGRQE
jgi:hypothetical protein